MRMGDESNQNISFAEFEFDEVHRRLSRDGEPLALYAKTFDLLAFLLRNNGRIVSKDEILAAVWADQFVEEANLSVQISALRKALGEKSKEPRFLLTVPGKGYKFVADLNGGDHDAELVIERHQFSRVVVDDTETSDVSSEKLIRVPEHGETISRSRWPGKKGFLLVGAVAAVAAVFLGGIWFVRWRSDRSRQLVLHRFTTQGGL